MRYVAALLIAVIFIFFVFWVGAKIAILVDAPHRDYNEYTVGRRMDLCGYQVDIRHMGGGYDLGRWRDHDCDALSELDRCILQCLSEAGTVGIGAACYSDCIQN